MWYRIGTVSLTNGSKVVTGSGTAWSANVQAGDAFHGPDGKTYEIDFVGSDASMNLVDAYTGSTASGQSYKVQPTQGRVRDLAAAVSTLITEYGSIEAALTVVSGNVGIGTSSPGRTLDVAGIACRFRGDNMFHEFYNGANSIRSGYLQINAAATSRLAIEVSQALAFQTAGVDRVMIDPSGNSIITLTDSAPSLTVARQMVFSRVSDTQLRISMRGADGTTRSVTLTLA